MYKKIIILIFLYFNLSLFAQEDLTWKTNFEEKFNDNLNGWLIESNEIRNIGITNGRLVDEYKLKGYMQANTILTSFNNQKDYKISFNIANQNGDASLQYLAYENRNGKLRDSWEKNPVWGFVWGFKDWNNYNCILFKNTRIYNSLVNGYYLYFSNVKILYKSNGNEVTLLDWLEFENIGSSTIEVSILQKDNTISIFLDNAKIYVNAWGDFQWYGNRIGPLIGAGSRVLFDNLKVLEKKPHPTTNWDESSLKKNWSNVKLDFIEGIYEEILNETGNKYKLGLVKNNNQYELVYLGGAENLKWKVGDIKAYLTKTATPNLFKAIYFMGNKSINNDLYVGFENGLMKIFWTDKTESIYLKLYPTRDDDHLNNGNIKSSGTGFAISSNGHIVTNHHVLLGASKITVRGVNGNFSKVYNAKVEVEDKNNDLAIIKIEDQSFTSLGELPYKISSGISDVGNSVYALGYPLRATMGDEVKLTNGIISSKTGFQGDITTYQTTVPVQPGNSGGPLFDSNGNVIGIINAKHIGAENASYAVKTSYLMNLIQAMNTSPSLPSSNTISNKNLSEQVKYLKEYVYIIEIY